MALILESKLILYLKLGRKLVQFIKWGTFFESRTFDWIQLEQIGNKYRATLIRSLDEGDETFGEVDTFTTLNEEWEESEEVENPFIEGDFETCTTWIQKKYGGKMYLFTQLPALKDRYKEMKREEK